MFRSLHILLLVLFLGNSAEGTGTLTEDHCSEGCEDDAQGKQCPPVCPTCACAPHAPLVTPADPRATLLPPPPAERDGFTHEQLTPPSPEPHDILHVPKSPLA